MDVFWKLFILISAVKLALIPAYRSTDFEVHRNWLAVTHSLPLRNWYTDSTSQWTLDYPPLFAYFEWCLSHVARWFDPGMLVVTNLDYASTATVVFQRVSVVVTDFLLAFALNRYVQQFAKNSQKDSSSLYSTASVLSLLVLVNTGLLIVDHIHFQYNGFLFGVLLMSILRMCQSRHVEGAFWFAILLNLKHIYLYVAPVYGVYLLRNYCFTATSDGRLHLSSFSPSRFISLAVVVVTVFAASFGPFVIMGQLSQVLSRLFPFKRGLCHAYWAPNFWALYNIVDKTLAVIGSRLGWLSDPVFASMTGGLVQEFEHTVLPSIRPIHTLLLTAASILPALVHTWLRPTGVRGFIRCLVMCAYGSFMFGWHVHEKAVLLIIIPLTLLSVDSKQDARLFLLLSTVGHFSLFPLLYTSAETPIKYLLFLLFTFYAYSALGKLHNDTGSALRFPLLRRFESVYVVGLLVLELYCSVLHGVLGLTDRLPFLPLLLTSVYCAVGVTYTWLCAYVSMLWPNMGLRLKQH